MRLTAIGIEKIKPPPTRREIPDSRGLYLVVQPKTGAKGWVMRFRRPNGKRCKLTLGKYPQMSLHEARKRCAEINEQREDDRDVFQEIRVGKVKHEENTFGAVVREFVEDHKVRGWRDIATVLGLKYPKAGGDPEEIKDGLASRWADRQIGDITRHDVNDVVTEAINRGTPGIEPKRKGAKSESRGRKMLDALGSLFKWAWYRRGRFMTVNPALGAYRPNPPKPRSRTLTDQELKLVWAACEEADYPFGSVVKLLVISGSRLNEIGRLGWKELNDDLITLPPARTKNHREHLIPLPPLALDILKKVKRRERCSFVFTTNYTTPISGWSKFKRQLDEAIAEKNGGEDIPPWRLHDVRRTCRTGLSKLRITREVAEAVLNHAQPGIEGTYNKHDYLEEKREALNRWAAHVEGIVAGKSANVVALRKLKRAT